LYDISTILSGRVNMSEFKQESEQGCLCHKCKKFDYDFYVEINCDAKVKDYETIKGIGVVKCLKFVEDINRR